MTQTSNLAASLAYVAQEQTAFADLMALGVTLGAMIPLTAEEARSGHTNCVYHLVVTEDGYDVDGASASTILSLLSDGTYSTKRKPSDYTLHPIEGRT